MVKAQRMERVQVQYVLIELPLVASKTGPDGPVCLSNLMAGRTLISAQVSTRN